MPNGGPDNCGNCLWNRTANEKRNKIGYCELRKIKISVPYWTYCDNFEFWSETLPDAWPKIEGPIYSSGVFEGYYTRIPWYGNSEPMTYTSGVCSVTGVRFKQGIAVIHEETGEEINFATNDIYCQWLQQQSSPETAPQSRKKESSGDKELHGIYTELFHQGKLCCDFMHLGEDACLEGDLDIQTEHDDYHELRDKIRGAILCGAIGDAMGRQVESLNPGTYPPATWYSPWSGWKSGPIGTITDDTQMTWWLADSLLAHSRLNPEDLAQRFCREHIRGIGKATREFVRNFKDRHLSWYDCGVKSSGNGAAMRAAPVGIFFRNNFDELKLAAGMQAVVTHNDPMAVASSIIVAFAVASLLRMTVYDLDDVGGKSLFCLELAEAIEGIEGDNYTTRRDGTKSTLAYRIGEEIPDFLGNAVPPQEVQKHFWSGAYVLESLPFALYCFLYSPGDFDRILFNAVNESRDSDTVAALACTFCGALNGLEENMSRMYWTKVKTDSDQDTVPEIRIQTESNYLEELEYLDDLLALSDNLTKDIWREP